MSPPRAIPDASNRVRSSVDRLRISWELNQLCNFRCHYCFIPHEKLATEHPSCYQRSPAGVAAAFDATGKLWHIHLSGGEPFLYPRFVDLCHALTQRHTISVNTNLSTSNVRAFAERIDPGAVETINAALHVEQREQRRTAKDKFIRHVLLLQNSRFPVRVEYVVHPNLLARVEADIHALRAAGIRTVNLKVFRGRFGGARYPAAYSPREKQFIRENTADHREIELMAGVSRVFGRACSAGRSSLKMDPAGNLYRCTSSRKPYGNLFQGKVYFDDTDRACPVPVCVCPYEGLANRSARKPPTLEIASGIAAELKYRLADDHDRKYLPRKLRNWIPNPTRLLRIPK